MPPQLRCENRWGGKELTWCDKKIFGKNNPLRGPVKKSAFPLTYLVQKLEQHSLTSGIVLKDENFCSKTIQLNHDVMKSPFTNTYFSYKSILNLIIHRFIVVVFFFLKNQLLSTFECSRTRKPFEMWTIRRFVGPDSGT